MSDTRNDAEQEMVNAGIASGLEDSLGVSLPPHSIGGQSDSESGT